jgi:FAD:protein FMN transferase
MINATNELASPSRRRALKLGGAMIAGGVLAAGGLAVWNRGRNLYQVRRERTLMKTSVSINVFSQDPAAADQAIEASFRRMAAVAANLSRFDAASPVARLNRDGYVTNPPPELTAVLRHALEMSGVTEGDFDVTVEPVLDYYYGLSRPVAISPDLKRAVAEREAHVGYRSIAMDGKSIRFTRAGMGMTLDGIAKGYVVDQGIAALQQTGIDDALVDAGGDLRAICSAGKRHWNVGIVDPLQISRTAAVIRIDNAAVSTSGNYEVFFSADRRLFHIINPHTGYSPQRYSSVTVVAKEAVETDALGVAGFFMDLPRMKVIMSARGAEWLAFDWTGAHRWRSNGLPLVAGEARIA